MNPMLIQDFYKVHHVNQYPKGTTRIYCNFTPRKSRVEGVEYIVVFGIKYLIEKYFVEEFNNNFFNNPNAVAKYSEAVGSDVNVDHIQALHDLGYLPIEVKCLPEMTFCPIGIPFLTIENTIDDFFWLPNALETLVSTTLWGMITSATTAYRYKKILTKWSHSTCDNHDHVAFQAHDFSMRGMFGVEASIMSGMGHLAFFKGTDCIPAIIEGNKYYDFEGSSVPATEHSVMCAGGKENESETFRRLIEDVYPNGIVSIVSDTWDLWNVIGTIIPDLKGKILKRNGKLVIRPDSGDPVKIICGDFEAPINSLSRKGVIECLWDIFGGTINEKGYRLLDDHIGCIYGDAITPERCEVICKILSGKGFASSNIVFGIGSYTYQYVTRDTYGMAIKATNCIINGVNSPIFKDPVTDDGTKKSAKGYLRVNDDFSLTENCSYEQSGGLLKSIFADGEENDKTND